MVGPVQRFLYVESTTEISPSCQIVDSWLSHGHRPSRFVRSGQCSFNEEHESKLPMYKDVDQYLCA